jgi:hypothetical protein
VSGWTNRHNGVCYECNESVTTDDKSILLHDSCHDAEITKHSHSIHDAVMYSSEADRLRALLREVAEKKCLNPALQDEIEEALK